MEADRVYMKDVRAATMCSRGGRAWFKKHNLDWMDFLKNGIEISRLEKIDDAMCARVVEVARGRRG